MPSSRVSGQMYNFRGLVFLVIFLLLFQLLFGFLALSLCSLIFHLEFSKVLELASSPDGTALSTNIARIVNFITFVGYMLGPALLFCLINQSTLRSEGGLNMRPGIKGLGWSIVLVMLSVLVVGFLDQLMRGMQWPAGIETFVKKLDVSRQLTIGAILNMRGPGDLIICLFILALLPAILEELLFRGIILNIFRQMTRGNAGLSIILQALIFTLLHLSFYEFFAILFMGMLFGIIAWHTRTIWYTAAMHFIFNAITVFAAYFAHAKPGAAAPPDPMIPWFWALPAFALIYLILTRFFPALQIRANNA